MGKISFLFLVVACLNFSSLNAAVYKGQKNFVKKCVKCHTSGQSFISSKTIFQWEDYLDNKGEELARVHLDDSKAEESWNYFNSSKYTKKLKHLKDFLLEYASDSGNVPACN